MSFVSMTTASSMLLVSHQRIHLCVLCIPPRGLYAYGSMKKKQYPDDG